MGNYMLRPINEIDWDGPGNAAVYITRPMDMVGILSSSCGDASPLVDPPFVNVINVSQLLWGT